MTEISDDKAGVPLGKAAERFILHWGEMGTRWGINRTVAQIHALLYISPRPLNAEQIAATLSVARSNVSNSLKELQSWGIIRVVHLMGDRRDHFESIADVWEMFQIILDERKRREIDPTLLILRECVSELESAKAPDKHALGRLRELLAFFESVTNWYGHVRRLPQTTLARFFKLGGKVGQWIRGKGTS